MGRRQAVTWFVLASVCGLAPAAAASPAVARAPSGGRCPPLEAHGPPPRGVEAAGMRAAVAAADHWIRRIAPEACPRELASIDTLGTEEVILWLKLSVEGSALESRVSLHRGCLPEKTPATATATTCGDREEDWHPMPPDERWLSSHLLEAATSWLRAHPEVVLVSREELGLGSWALGRIETTAGSTFCVQDGSSWDPPSYRACWADPRPIAEFSAGGFSWPPRKRASPRVSPDDDSYQYDHVRGFVALGPFDAHHEVWAVRFPEAERVLVERQPHTPAGPAADDRRPAWFPVPQRSAHAAPEVLPSKGWQPIPTTPAPELGALESVDTNLVASGGPDQDLTVLDLRAGPGTATCARQNGSWSCAPPTFLANEESFVIAAHDDARVVPSRAGPPWLLAQRSTIEDGGNGDGSGADGNQFLEIYRQSGARLQALGSIVLGRMAWTTKRRKDGYWRSIARYTHKYTTAGPDCLRIERAVQHRGWADGSFLTAHPPGAPAATRARLPSQLVPGVVPLTGIPPEHDTSQDARLDVEANGDSRVILRDFSGVWCIEPDRLVRVARDPRATDYLPPPALPSVLPPSSP